MKKRFLIAAIFFSIITLISCEEDDVCVGEGTPFLTVVFRNPLNTVNYADSLSIFESKTPDFTDADTIYYKEITDSVKLPLGGLNDDVSYFKIMRRSNPDTDVLKVNYNSQSSYVSKACGYRITYEGLEYETSHNLIEYLIPDESNGLEDESKTNLYVIYSY
jgi:hypothetical protein